jgi:hypothetical protein
MTITPQARPTGFWLPSDDGFLGANSDLATSSGGGLTVATNLYLIRLPVRASQLISAIWTGVAVIGGGTDNGNFVGLYAPISGTQLGLLSGSGSQAANWSGTTGWKQGNLTTPQLAAGGATPASWPFAAVLCNFGTTQVSLERQLNTNFAAPQVVANTATLRWAQVAAVGTTLPATVNFASMAVTALTYSIAWS